jgi:GntR family transcriptional regulator
VHDRRVTSPFPDGGTSRPKHEQLRDRLRKRVRGLPAGTVLPTERELASEFGVARMTLRQAIAALAREGLLRSEQGRGTFVLGPPLELRVKLGSFAEEMRRHHLAPSTETLECVLDAEPPSAVRRHLRLRSGQAAVRLRRLRLGNGQVLAVERIWLPRRIGKDLVGGLRPDSLYDYLEEQGVLPDGGEESVAAGLADDAEARAVGIGVGMPVLRLVRQATHDGQPVEYAEAVLPADRYVLWFPLRPGQDGRLFADLGRA